MSKLLKSFSILGILLLVAGGIVFCVALAAVDWDIFAFSDTNVVPQYYTEPTNASFDRVELYFANADVQITFVEGLEELSIEYPLLTDRNGNPRNEMTVTSLDIPTNIPCASTFLAMISTRYARLILRHNCRNNDSKRFQ